MLHPTQATLKDIGMAWYRRVRTKLPRGIQVSELGIKITLACVYVAGEISDAEQGVREFLRDYAAKENKQKRTLASEIFSNVTGKRVIYRIKREVFFSSILHA